MKRSPEPSGGATFGRATNMPQILAGWDEFITRLRSSSPMLASQVRMAELRSVQDNQIQAFFAASGETSLELVTKREHSDLISQTLREHYKTNLTIAFNIDHAKKDTDDSRRPKAPRVTPAELVERSPRLKRLLERVDGEIIGIKNVNDK